MHDGASCWASAFIGVDRWMTTRETTPSARRTPHVVMKITRQIERTAWQKRLLGPDARTRVRRVSDGACDSLSGFMKTILSWSSLDGNGDSARNLCGAGRVSLSARTGPPTAPRLAAGTPFASSAQRSTAPTTGRAGRRPTRVLQFASADGRWRENCGAPGLHRGVESRTAGLL